MYYLKPKVESKSIIHCNLSDPCTHKICQLQFFFFLISSFLSILWDTTLQFLHTRLTLAFQIKKKKKNEGTIQLLVA